ncbi:DUF4232 domain-containing protein [Streptomyces sp. NBC_01789]|uniref:DUF4232 domain-containing protein n=1 Tax=Streptomyces sp. NBC_01789 TaxID=2975941 RepID=UPI00224D1D6B|nr:DUF4232 domain-containing protein [Streptomyces sp. NBC_01789]MCX4447660.1 DUF4232 domain-containing protein [Streptomyces sp. NBC_01789]
MRTTFRSRKRTATIGAALTAALALALTACNGDDNASGSTPAGTTASAGQSGGTGGAAQGDQSADTGTGGSSQGTGGSGSTGGNSSDGKVGICRTDALAAAAADDTTGGTEGVVTVSFKNNGGSDCRMSGFPGVDLKTSMGDTFSVDRNGEQAVAQVLKAGESAAFTITFPVNDSGGSGVQLTDMVVTPPNETKPITLKWPAGSLAVSDGEDDGKMQVSPVGKISD